MKKVSIIIPAYNSEKYIGSCMDSVLSQTYPNLEVIVIDDGSTDHTLYCLNQYHNSNLKIIHNEINQGVSYSRNLGINQADGDFILFVDSDDILESTMVETMMHYSTNSNVVICNYDTFFKQYQMNKNSNLIHPTFYDNAHKKESIIHQSSYCWNKLFPRNIIEQQTFIQGINYEDIAYTYFALISSDSHIYLDNILYHYRRNINGITISNKRFPNTNFLDIITSLEQLCHQVKSHHFYDEYQDIIQVIDKHYCLLTLLDISLWVKIPYQTRIELCSLLTQFYEKKFKIDQLLQNPMTQLHMSTNLLYRFRVNYTNHLFLQKQKYLNTDDEINLVKQKIKEFQS